MELDHSSGKKSVRFSSPFDLTRGPEATVLKQPSKRKIAECSAQKETAARNLDAGFGIGPGGTGGGRDSSSASGDSWDAFDAKMMKSKAAPPTKVVQNQFLELSINQNKSLSIMEKEEDFASMSFQDAEELIGKDENERLQFMNSNLSFDEAGLDQVEPPSLLSFTSYFQQGSSFPVPYVGNDSTMMFGGGLPPGVSSFMDPQLASETLRRFSNSSQQHRESSINKRASTAGTEKSSGIFTDSSMGSIAGDKSGVERQDSLARFFLGPEAKGMGKADIMEHVLDYCKRRASFRNSDNSTLNSPQEDSSESADADPAARRNSMFEYGHEKTLIDLRNQLVAETQKPSSTTKTKGDVKRTDDDHEDDPKITNSNQDESIVISDGASKRDGNGALMDVSDVPENNDGFEKFKRNLGRRIRYEDRYRGKVKHHVEFENKRLQIDERYSHPQLSPRALNGPGATASLERPRKRLICNSPPEKLITPRNAPAVNENVPVRNSQESETPGAQCHSTPVATESFIKRILNSYDPISSREEKIVPVVSSRGTTVEPERLKVDTLNNHQIQGASKKPDSSGTDSASSELAPERKVSGSGTQLRRRKSPLTLPDRETREIHSQATQIIDSSVVSSRSTNASNSNTNVLKTSNSNVMPPQSLSVVPVIHSTGQPHPQQQQHFSGHQQQCSCPHQCGPQPMSHGMPGMMQGLPIVIHIHLPCPTTTSGAVMHPVPTPTTDGPPK